MVAVASDSVAPLQEQLVAQVEPVAMAAVDFDNES